MYIRRRRLLIPKHDLNLSSDLAFHQRPDLRIAVHRIVRFEQVTIEPWIGAAFSWLGCVVESDVPEYLRSAWIQRLQHLAAVSQTTGLIEIQRLRNVRWNGAIVAPRFIDAVQLNC